MTGQRKPFTKRERTRMTTCGFGHRPVNDWGGGDLPAPFAEGDVLHLDAVPEYSRLHGMGPGYFVVTYATSIDEGDAWYFRVSDGNEFTGSDRMHVAFPDRCAPGSWEPVNWMAPFDLVESADPEGLARRERMIADGWAFTDHWQTCPTCGHTVRKRDQP